MGIRVDETNVVSRMYLLSVYNVKYPRVTAKFRISRKNLWKIRTDLPMGVMGANRLSVGTTDLPASDKFVEDTQLTVDADQW